jgi:outer membrane biosynthesis protein TonB
MPPIIKENLVSYKDENPEHLEYNDGVGDLLREKMQPQFSWIKTISVLIGLILAVLLGLILAFYIGKKVITPQPQKILTPIIEEPAALPTPNSLEIETPPLKKSPPKVEEKKQEPKKKPKPKPATIANSTKKTPKTPYKVIAGKYPTHTEVKIIKDDLAAKGIASFSWIDPTAQEIVIQVGAFENKEKADDAVKSLKKKGVDTKIISH